MKKALATAAWLAVTVFAVAIGSTAVAVVGDRLGDSPSAPLAQPQLEALPTETSTTTTAARTTPSTTPIPAPTSTVPPATSTTVPGSPSSAPTTAAVTTTTTTTTTTIEPASSDVRVYQLVGGQVVIEVMAHGVLWRSSTPSPGFKVEVESKGPERVEVEFEATNDSHSSQFTATWTDGDITVDVDEDD